MNDLILGAFSLKTTKKLQIHRFAKKVYDKNSQELYREKLLKAVLADAVDREIVGEDNPNLGDIEHIDSLLSEYYYYKLIRESDIPLDEVRGDKRWFRMAWTFDGEDITVPIDKAKFVHVEKLSALRDKKVSELKIQEKSALDDVNIDKVLATRAQIAEINQKWSNQDLDVSNHDTIEELKKFIPDYLK